MEQRCNVMVIWKGGVMPKKLFLGRTVYDEQEKQFGEVVRVSPAFRVDIAWEDGSLTRSLSLKVFHVWDSGYSFI